MTDVMTEFQSFFKQYQQAWNGGDAKKLVGLFSKDLQVREAHAGNDISDWGYEQSLSGWQQAFDAYGSQGPKWHFHEVTVNQVSDDEVMAVFWVTFELNGKLTSGANFFVETFRREIEGWRLYRSYSEAGIPKKYVSLPPEMESTATQ